ncbi:MAG: hypothetical protein ABI203_05650 [Mucilaginibacter sp.]
MKPITKIKLCLWIIIIGLVLSGLTAFPLETELGIISSHISAASPFYHWFNSIYTAIKQTNEQFPYLSYGTDWLAFAHLVIAIVFIGPLRDPVKNIWVIEFGMIACILIFPLAFIAGSIRGIPFYWRLIDCSFGIIGFIPLYICKINIKKLQSSG